VDNTVEPVSRSDFGEHMDVVWHHAPGDQCITLTVEAQQCVLYQFCDLRIGQVATTMPLVKRAVGCLDPLIGWFRGKPVSQPRRKAVRQSEDDVLDNIRRVNVRKVTA
jgi:hypothetical protein